MGLSQQNREELAQFLRSRRERISPEEVGFPHGGHRRTPGLRREEVAVLAGISPSWYTYLEQGRDANPSPEVLDNLARVLALSEDERHYLHALVIGSWPSTDTAPPAVRGGTREPLMRAIVNQLDPGDYPLYATNRYTDIVAWNRAAESWYGDFGELPASKRNMAWWLFTSTQARRCLVDWEHDAHSLVGRLRSLYIASGLDDRFTRLVEELQQASPEFRRLWHLRHVEESRVRIRRVRLGDGSIESVSIVVLRVSDDPMHRVVLHLPARDTDNESPAEEKLPVIIPAHRLSH